ncbi:MAG TPA: ABC transporter permease [Oligoflexia bacterium]|nr:ABC transporter permease [Oligoflexia bacterium]HMR24793.1 ABC transporter permease [Oligoflexia bacterium]
MNASEKHNSILHRFVAFFGQQVKLFLSYFIVPLSQTGAMCLLFYKSINYLFKPPIRWRELMNQMKFVGVNSLFIVVLTGAFTGMVFALQSGRSFAYFGAESLTGSVVALTLSREIAPTLTALMVTARAGSAMAAQLGTMQVTQQIDALRAMAVSPIDYLIAPRLAASIIVMPFLTSIFNFVGLAGAYVVGIYLLGIDEGSFVEKIRYYTDVPDYVQGLFKSIFFGLIMAMVCCYKGTSAKRGAADVGQKVTEAVVISSVAILVADYFLTAIFF